MMRYKFLVVGDTFKSSQETIHFHRDMTYKVSHVFNDKGKFRVFISDKNGKDVEYGDYYFNATLKTTSASEERQKLARLDFYWDNPLAPFVINPSYFYNFETTEFFELENRAHFGSKGDEKTIAKISRHKKEHTDSGWRIHEVEGSEGVFQTKQDYYDYFKNIDAEKIRLNGTHSEPQYAIDHLYFMLTVPHFDESLLNLPEVVNNMAVGYQVGRDKMTLPSFLKLCAEVIFDEDDLSDSNKKIIYNIVEAYELLPNSFGPTAASKLLLGKEKKKNQHVEHLSGTCTTLKQPQLFTLCDIVETFMYYNDIFIKKDAYGETKFDEWPGIYEYIGSKIINKELLTQLKNLLK